MRDDKIDHSIEELEDQLRELEIRQQRTKARITELKARRARRRAGNGFSRIQLGDRVYAKISGTLNVRSGTVIGVAKDKITYRGDCGTKTWRAPKNLEVTERPGTQDEFYPRKQ